MLPPDPEIRQVLAEIIKAANEPVADLDQGLSLVAQPDLAGEEIADLAPDTEHPSVNPILPSDARDTSIADSGDVIFLREMHAAIKIPADVGPPAHPIAEPRATAVLAPGPIGGGQPALLPNALVRAARAGEIGTTLRLQAAPAAPEPLGPGWPDGNSGALNPMPDEAGEAAAIDSGKPAVRMAPANAPAPAPPGAMIDVPDANPAATHDLATNAKSLNMAGTGSNHAGDRAPARGMNLPNLAVRIGERGVQKAPKLASAPAAPRPGEKVAGPGAIPAPDFPELRTVAARGRSSIVHEAVMQAQVEFEQIGVAASTAASTQSPSGSAQQLATALHANAGGAEIARAVAPQIVTAIGSAPGSGRIELRLDPPELGNVEILLEITDQSLRATVMAERPATNELLRRHGEVLLTQLQQAGFTGIELQFTGNRTGNQGSAHPGDTPRPTFTADPDTRSGGENPDLPASRNVRRASGGLDLRL
jgi:hypothetical protein